MTRGERRLKVFPTPTEVTTNFSSCWPIFCPRHSSPRRRFHQQLVEADRTSALVASTTCPLHRPYLWMSTMSYWVGLGSSRCWYLSKTDYSAVRCQKTVDKTRSLMPGESYHHSPTASLVLRTRGGEVLHSHPPKSFHSHCRQGSEVGEGVGPAASQVETRAWGKTTLLLATQ